MSNIKWKKLSEEVPEKQGRYLVIWKTGVDRQYPAFAEYFREGWVIEGDNMIWPCEITHWAQINLP